MILLLAVFACSTAPAPAGPQGPPPSVTPESSSCDVYRADPGTYARCVSDAARDLESAKEARERCAALPHEAEVKCRSAWVDRHAGQAGASQRPEIEAMCQGSDDCGLLLAEAWAEPDPVEQFKQCTRLAGRFIADCNGHALDRWARKRPDAAERARLAEHAAEVPQIAYWIGVVLRCEGAPEIVPGVDHHTAATTLGCPAGVAENDCVQGFVDTASRPELCNVHANALRDGPPPPPPGIVQPQTSGTMGPPGVVPPPPGVPAPVPPPSN